MSYLATSAANRLDLFTAIRNFAVADGWTANWNVTSNNGQVGLSKSGTFVAFGSRTTTPDITRNQQISGGTVTDGIIVGTLATAFSGTQTYAGGHTGAPGGTTLLSDAHVWSNDWTGPFTNVWLFSGPSGDYVHVVAQTGLRFSHFSFGKLDLAGFTHANVSYLTGQFYTWWESNGTNNSLFSSTRPDASSGSSYSSTSATLNAAHTYAFFNRNGALTNCNIQYQVPTGVWDNAVLGITAPLITTSGRNMMLFLNKRATIRGSATEVRLMDAFNFTSQLPYTAGNTLMSIPAAHPASFTGAAGVFLGLHPGVRLVNMEGLSPGKEIEISGDVWKCFPMKQKGAEAQTETGGIVPNSWFYGLAYRK